jgi:hypothetical protein
MSEDTAPTITHSGHCHCGAVRFEVDAPARIEVLNCNCSICSMTGYQHLVVTAAALRVLAGEDLLTTYTFNTNAARHTFCSRCGIKPFYVPRSHPDGFSVNVRCLDPATIESIESRDFDGRNWEQSISSLAPLSKKG